MVRSTDVSRLLLTFGAVMVLDVQGIGDRSEGVVLPAVGDREGSRRARSESER